LYKKLLNPHYRRYLLHLYSSFIAWYICSRWIWLWIRNKNTIEYLGIWEWLNNQNFKPFEFEGVKNEAWSNAFVMTPKKWIDTTNAIWIISKSWRYGWTYAHKDIAFKFASMIIYLIYSWSYQCITKINPLNEGFFLWGFFLRVFSLVRVFNVRVCTLLHSRLL